MNTTALTLDKAASILRKAQDIYQDRMLDVVRELRVGAWHEAYYSSSSLKSFTRRFEAYRKQAGATLRGTLECAYVAVVAAWQCYDAARLAEKARKADKRAAVAAKRDLKAELNLQEGVSLKGVDVGQYKVILAGLEPVRLHVYAQRKEALEADVADLDRRVYAAGRILDSFNPPVKWNAGDESYRRFLTLDKLVRRWFEVSGTGYVSLKPDNAETIEKLAEQFALAYVQGYAAKLSVKTGEAIANDAGNLQTFVPVSAKVSSDDLWRNSVAAVTLECPQGGRAVLKFHTQIIWNRSCLGKVFNQYPTRRID